MMPIISALRQLDPVSRMGRIRRVLPTLIEADGPNVPIGTLCRIGDADVLAQTVGLDNDKVSLAPFGDVAAITPGMLVCACNADARLSVGNGYAGRSIDALGRPIDGGDAIYGTERIAFEAAPISPLERITPSIRLNTGLRAIDALMPLVRGQRLGIFAASGVGKTTLLNQFARQTQADRIVICLIGERGREVEALWNDGLIASDRARAVLVAATSDEAAALRIRAVYQSLALARYWRDQGLDVLFLLDSVTRLAMAMRETGLAAGEPPMMRGYTPSVFAAMPRIVEQCGALRSGGSISALFTVLSESDDVDDPISEVMKSVLDGHIILSRTMAERGHFPAIDIGRSISRLALTVMDKRQKGLAAKVRKSIATYDNARMLIETGLYKAGSDFDIDQAVAQHAALDEFLQQQDDYTDVPAMFDRLSTIIGASH
jgi:flagellum-specific ATP synthase